MFEERLLLSFGSSTHAIGENINIFIMVTQDDIVPRAKATYCKWIRRLSLIFSEKVFCYTLH